MFGGGFDACVLAASSVRVCVGPVFVGVGGDSGSLFILLSLLVSLLILLLFLILMFSLLWTLLLLWLLLFLVFTAAAVSGVCY